MPQKITDITITEQVTYRFERQQLPAALLAKLDADTDDRDEAIEAWFCNLQNPFMTAAYSAVEDRDWTIESTDTTPTESKNPTKIL